MPINYILVDFENIQPNNFDLLNNFNCKILIFVGSNQKKISFEMVDKIQSFGINAKYIKIEGNGQSALDFHIAFYIGQISKIEKNVSFYVISKDSGFDPLINHLKLKKINVKRLEDIKEIKKINGNTNSYDSLNKIRKEESLSDNNKDNIKKIVLPTNDNENINKIISFLNQKVNKPKTYKALSNTINDLFRKKIDEQKIKILLEEILRKEYISINNNKLIYSLPKK